MTAAADAVLIGLSRCCQRAPAHRATTHARETGTVAGLEHAMNFAKGMHHVGNRAERQRADNRVEAVALEWQVLRVQVMEVHGNAGCSDARQREAIEVVSGSMASMRLTPADSAAGPAVPNPISRIDPTRAPACAFAACRRRDCPWRNRAGTGRRNDDRGSLSSHGPSDSDSATQLAGFESCRRVLRVLTGDDRCEFGSKCRAVTREAYRLHDDRTQVQALGPLG